MNVHIPSPLTISPKTSWNASRPASGPSVIPNSGVTDNCLFVR